MDIEEELNILHDVHKLKTCPRCYAVSSEIIYDAYSDISTCSICGYQNSIFTPSLMKK